jgi:hypothetical protein
MAGRDSGHQIRTIATASWPRSSATRSGSTTFSSLSFRDVELSGRTPACCRQPNPVNLTMPAKAWRAALQAAAAKVVLPKAGQHNACLEVSCQDTISLGLFSSPRCTFCVDKDSPSSSSRCSFEASSKREPDDRLVDLDGHVISLRCLPAPPSSRRASSVAHRFCQHWRQPVCRLAL